MLIITPAMWLTNNGKLYNIQKWLGGFSKQVSLHKNLFIDILKFPKLFLIKTKNFHVSVSLHLSPGVSSISIKCSSSGTLVSSGNSIKLISPCKNCPLINEKKNQHWIKKVKLTLTQHYFY